MKKEFSLQRAAAVAFVSLGLAASAFAHPGHGRGDGKDDKSSAKVIMRKKGAFLKELARLREDLKLDAKQEALWTEAMDSRKAGREKIRERMRAHHEEMKKLTAQPGLDARAMFKRIDEFEAELRENRLQQRERLLKTYEALTGEQKEKVRLFFTERFERGHFFKERFGHKRMGRAHRGGDGQ
ncbi:MAG: periplasmic heavy metal sensor [Candidatus Accumulibacter sp.]|jgi:Spy/CpxP family protein refolding chaperone|nr:periplasmic heavy metal sensor [Accumulibacter sp.]